MPMFDEGCVVRHGPTNSLYTVVRWDQEAEVLLLTPVVSPSTDRSSSSSSSSSSSNDSAGKQDRARTRWAFEHMVSLVEKSKSTTKVPKATTKDPPETKAEDRGPGTKSAAAAGASSVPASCSNSSSISSGKDVNVDRTSYARRTAKLDSRVEIRRHPNESRGRGLFAVRDLPRGTEVMRVPAAAAVLLSRKRAEACGGCFLSTKEVGSLEACRGCSLRFCAGCRKRGGGAGHTTRMCELTKVLLMICATPTGGRPPDEGNLRLLAEVLVRRGAGEIGDEEWDLLKSLESQDNETRTTSPPPRVLDSCGRLLKQLMGIDVSLEELQAMYRRVTRNAHTGSPNTTHLGFGSVQGLFPCGALVNHSCMPNTFFHCVSEPSSSSSSASSSSSSSSPSAVKQVLRTTRDIRAGEELCYSYLASGAAMIPVEERREMLQGWGFQCSCERCEEETRENKRMATRRTRIEDTALGILKRLEQITDLGQRKKLALTEGKTVEGLFSELQGMVQFLARAREGKISPLLAGRLAIGLLEASEIVRIPDPLFMFFVYRAAADELSSTGSPMEVTLRYKQYLNSTRPVEGLNSSQSQMLKHVKTSGIDALRRAVELQAMFYGEEHEQTFRLRRQAESALRFA